MFDEEKLEELVFVLSAIIGTAEVCKQGVLSEMVILEQLKDAGTILKKKVLLVKMLEVQKRTSRSFQDMANSAKELEAYLEKELENQG